MKEIAVVNVQVGDRIRIAPGLDVTVTVVSPRGRFTRLWWCDDEDGPMCRAMLDSEIVILLAMATPIGDRSVAMEASM